MRNRAFRSIAAILSILLLTGVPSHAAPIVVSDVIQVLSNYRNAPELRLRSASQNSSSLPGLKGSLDLGIPTVRGPLAPPDSFFATVAIGTEPTIDVIDQGDVEATVCDCGEIIVPGGAWPKWPLLFLAAIPLFFIPECDDCDITTPTPTPPPPTHTPEPASLLLLGTGLIAFGAGLRRRYSRAQLKVQIRATKEEA